MLMLSSQPKASIQRTGFGFGGRFNPVTTLFPGGRDVVPLRIPVSPRIDLVDRPVEAYETRTASSESASACWNFLSGLNPLFLQLQSGRPNELGFHLHLAASGDRFAPAAESNVSGVAVSGASASGFKP
jgi:hypothetical protein